MLLWRMMPPECAMVLKHAAKWMGAVMIAGVLAMPALADGRDKTPVVGPTPLKPVQCEHGYYADGRCYVPQRQSQTIRTPSVTRTVTHAPTTTVRRYVQSHSTQAAQGFDFSGFDGGVGAGVSGGFAGGGGGNVIIIRDGQRFSGVRSNPVGRAVLGGHYGG